jgi:23S rRNA (adenine2503-C2)-methyltransferase
MPPQAQSANAFPPAETPAAERFDVLGKSAAELRAWMTAIGERPYRGAQLYHAVCAERRFDFATMSNLPEALRARLAQQGRIGLPRIARRYLSADGSVRYLLELPASSPAPSSAPGVEALREARVETVFMPSENRQTICVSSQAGCAVDCHFCLTAQLGLIRNLSAGEIVGQVLLALEDHREALKPRTNVVLMGQGEPLLNYEPVLAAVRVMLDSNGMGLAPKHVTLSTSGIVPGIQRLAQEKVRPKLAVSLNASTDQQRDAIMPINRKYPLEVLLDACRRYGELITFEYVLLGGFNDAPEDARRVVRLLSGMQAKVNLIPWNPGALPYRAPDPGRVKEFHRILMEKGQFAFVRYSRGQDISAACGQLALLEGSAPSPIQIL